MKGSDFSPRDVGRLIDEAIAAYRSNFPALARAVGLTLLPVALLYGITQVFYVRGMLDAFSAITKTSGVPQYSDDMMIAYALSGTASLAYMAGQVYFRSVIYASAPALLSGPKPTAKQLLTGGLAIFFPLLALQFLTSVITSTATLLSLPALGVGGLVAVVFLSVVGPAYGLERGNLLHAYRRSVDLVKGNFWRVVLLTIGLAVVMFELESALTSPIVVRDVVLSLQSPGVLIHQLPAYWKVLEGIIQALSIVLVVPIAELVWVRCYLDLRARNEGLDLLMRAQALAAGAR